MSRELIKKRRGSSRGSHHIINKVLLVFLILLVVSNQSTCSNISAEKDQDTNDTDSKAWRLYKSIKVRLYEVYTAATSFYTGSKSNLVSSGMNLLNVHNDPVGAEILCKSAVKETPFELNAWICLGESRLSIHNAAWSRNNQGDFVFQILSEAKMNFMSALELDHGATNARVRLDLGVALYLTAIRNPMISSKESSQLLFDAVNHLKAAASLTSSSLNLSQSKDGLIKDERFKIHIASLYNLGIAHLAIGDTSSSISLFRKVSDLFYHINQNGLSVPELNLAAAIGQKGNTNDSFNRLHELSLKYCNIDFNIIDEDFDESFMINFSKMCSLIHKNLEMNSRAQGKFIDIAISGSEMDTEIESIADRSNLITVDDSQIASNISKESSGPISNTNDVIAALEIAVNQDPNNVNLFITLSHAKIKTGEHEYAIDAALMALKRSSNSDERNRASIALELAFRSSNVDIDKLNASKKSSEYHISPVRRSIVNDQDLNPKNYRLDESFISYDLSMDAPESKENEPLDKATNATSMLNNTDVSQSDDGDQNFFSIQVKNTSFDHQTSNNDLTDDFGGQHDSPDLNTDHFSSLQFESSTVANFTDTDQEDFLEAKPNHNENDIFDASESKPTSSNVSFLDEKVEKSHELILPPLYKASKKITEPLCQTSLSYMKMADAYMQNGNYKAASKQFLKVLRKTSYTHIPALLGYASSLERLGSPQTFFAYSNVTENALSQDANQLAIASFDRALASVISMENGKLEALHHLLTVCFTNKFAAEIYFNIGLEMSLHSADRQEIIDMYKLADAYSAADDGNPHAPSLLELAKLAFFEKKYEKALIYINKALAVNLDERKVEALTYLGRIKEFMSDWDGAMQAYKEAVALPALKASPDACYYFGLYLRAHGGSDEEVKLYIEKALNLGFNLTAEATEILGEHNMAVIKSSHRAEWQRYQDLSKEQELRGGIMNRGPVSGNSIFSQSEKQGLGDDKLSLLEQGAVSYDGSFVPMGESETEFSSLNTGSLSRSKAVS